jgi:hypothetical protein
VSDAAASAVVVSEPRPARRLASSGLSAAANLRSFGIALVLTALTVALAGGVALLLAAGFYGYGGLG